MTPDAAASTGDTRQRIVTAGIECLVNDGLSACSMADIAQRSGVSKALVHYHFGDRAHLLAEMIGVLGRVVTSRERDAFESGNAARSVDALWRWFDGELQLGQLRALLLLGALSDTDMTRGAYEEAQRAREAAATNSITRLFARLDITPRIDPALIAPAVIAFTDGVALGHSKEDARMAFDVFWLAILELG